MYRLAILSNGRSSNITDRVELVELSRAMGFQPFCGCVFDGSVNEYYSEHTATCLPIDASRNNTNPFVELKSLFNVANQIKKTGISFVVIYGVKNHSAMAIGSKLGGAKKILCVVNGRGNLFRVPGLRGKLIRFIAFPMLRIAYGISSSVCFQNNDDLELFRKTKLIKGCKDVFVTGGSGVNLATFPFAPLPDENRFLFLSRITPTKGIKEYCEAARIVKAKYPSAAFDVFGRLDNAVETGDVKEVLDKAVEDKIVNYGGFANRVARQLQKCRFFIYPSYYPEGAPRCALQALSTGRPIITCDSPGCRETVDDGINGFLVKAGDVDGLAQKMIWMIENPEGVEEMGKRSREIAEKKFDVNKVNDTLMKHLRG